MGQILIKQEISVHNVKIDNNTNKVQGKVAAEGMFKQLLNDTQLSSEANTLAAQPVSFYSSRF